MKRISIHRVVPNITSSRIEESVKFYTQFLGFKVAMNMGWIVTVISPTCSTAQISLVKGESSNDSDAVTLSIEVDNVDALYEQAISQDYEVVYALTDEPWGVRRFHVKDPNGITINVMCHLRV